MAHGTTIGTARAVAEISAGDVVAGVQIEAPLDRVFAAFTDPREILHWWGDAAHDRITEWVPSVDPGGRFRAVGVMPDGKPFVVDGEYLEVSSPHRFVHTWKDNRDHAHGLVTTVSCHLEAREGGTHLTLRHTDFHGNAAALERHVKSWPPVLDALARFAEGDAPAAL